MPGFYKFQYITEQSKKEDTRQHRKGSAKRVSSILIVFPKIVFTNQQLFLKSSN